RADQVRRDVDPRAVDGEVAVADQLAGLGVARREPAADRDVVEPPLEQRQQVLTGDALHPGGLEVVAAELLLEQPVHALDLLLLAQLVAVVARPSAPTLAM